MARCQRRDHASHLCRVLRGAVYPKVNIERRALEAVAAHTVAANRQVSNTFASEQSEQVPLTRRHFRLARALGMVRRAVVIDHVRFGSKAVIRSPRPPPHDTMSARLMTLPV